MGMPATVEIADAGASEKDVEAVFSYFKYVDEKFSTYKDTSEISVINKGALKIEDASADMKEVFKLAEETKKLTNGYFDIRKPDGKYDPSGLVKGWAIHNAAKILKGRGLNNFYIDLAGDIETSGKNSSGGSWRIGIRSPFNQGEIIKVINVENRGVATSGTYIRGQHIYNPHDKAEQLNEVVSVTVIGPNVYEADRYATAVFAMGREGAAFVGSLDGFECYMVDNNRIATMTNGFREYIAQ